MRNLSDHFAYSLIIIINIYSEISEVGADNAQISVTWPVRAVTCTAGENSPPYPSPLPPPPIVSPPVVGGARSIQGQRSGRERGESLRVNHHLGHTEYTDSVHTVHKNQFLHKNSLYTLYTRTSSSIRIVCIILTVQSVHKTGFETRQRKMTQPLTRAQKLESQQRWDNGLGLAAYEFKALEA